jgi:hypothetical protein
MSSPSAEEASNLRKTFGVADDPRNRDDRVDDGGADRAARVRWTT